MASTYVLFVGKGNDGELTARLAFSAREPRELLTYLLFTDHTAGQIDIGTAGPIYNAMCALAAGLDVAMPGKGKGG